jgi:hypothetical protein
MSGTTATSGSSPVNDASANWGAGGGTSDTVLLKPGDTLQSIADKAGVPLQDLMAENHITDPNLQVIAPRELMLPKHSYADYPKPPSGDGHQVKPGPVAGSLGSRQEVDLRLRQATLQDITSKASAAGLGPVEVARLATSLAKLPTADFNREASLLRDALNSRNPDRALRTYLDIEPLRSEHPDRITPQIERSLVMGVATSRTNLMAGVSGVLGEDSAHRAAETLVKMPASEYKQIAGALQQAGTGGGPNGSAETERALILKAVAARQDSLSQPTWGEWARMGTGKPSLPTDDILRYASAIRGKDRSDLIEKSTVQDLDNPSGSGALQQRFNDSCGPTSGQIAKAEADPIAALRMHQEAIHSTANGGAIAIEQSITLTFGGGVPVPYGQSGGKGMKGGDAFNPVASSATHRTYNAEGVDDSVKDRENAMDEMARQLRQGIDVPIRVLVNGGGGHFEVATDVRDFPPTRLFLITNPWTGSTAWVKEEDIASGNTNFAGTNGRLTHIYPGSSE